MTTIAYRRGVLAADTMFCRGATTYVGIVKIARRDDGLLIAYAGGASFGQAFERWALAGEQGDPPKGENTAESCDTGLLFRQDDSIQVFEAGSHFTCRPDYYAIGSGRDQAIGAMFVGAEPEAAVRAAIAHDAYTGGDVIVLRR